MSTPANLAQSGLLIPYRLSADHPGLPERMLYLSAKMEIWMDSVLPYLPRDRCAQMLPLEQVEAIFESYISDPHFSGVGLIQRISPTPKGVVEMKTVDVRIFGWFWRPGQIIVHHGGLKKNLKDTEAVNLIREDVVSYRNSLNLDHPPFTTSDHIHALLHVKN